MKLIFLNTKQSLENIYILYISRCGRNAILPIEKWMSLNLSSNESRRDGAVRGILMKNAGVAAGFSLVVNTLCC